MACRRQKYKSVLTFMSANADIFRPSQTLDGRFKVVRNPNLFNRLGING
jgi:hypothetical protein